MVPLPGCDPRGGSEESDRIKRAMEAMLKKPVVVPAPGEDRLLARLSSELISLLQEPNPGRRAMVIKLIEGGKFLEHGLDGDEVVAFNTSIDLWTRHGKPAALLVRSPDGFPGAASLGLRCTAPPRWLPITAILDDGQRQTRHVFWKAGVKQVSLPQVPSGSRRLFIITTDRTFRTSDERRLGVQLSAAWAPR